MRRLLRRVAAWFARRRADDPDEWPGGWTDAEADAFWGEQPERKGQ